MFRWHREAMALCRRGRLSIFRGEVGSAGNEVSSLTLCPRFDNLVNCRGAMALCRRGRLSIFRGEVGSAGNEVSSLTLCPRYKQKTIARDYGAAVAQGTHNPLVVGSNPSGPIKNGLDILS